MISHETKKEKKTYNCKVCDYHTSRKSSWERHSQTARHQRKMIQAEKKPICCPVCKKQFGSRTSYWRHAKKCKEVISREELLRENIKLKRENEKKDEQLIAKDKHADVLATTLASVTQIAQKRQVQTVNNQCINNNQKISINVYLNEHCKDALNLEDFVKQITLSFEDLQQAKQNGSVQSIGDLFVKHLTDLKPTERPIHCSDKKRLKFYVKDDNKWEKDDDKIDDSIRKINNKQHNKLNEWQEAHPDWQKNAAESEEYMKMVENIAWMSNDCQKNKEKIKRVISSVTEIKREVKNEQ